MTSSVQGRPLLIGLRPEVIRIAEHSGATSFERPLTGIVEHVEFQGHEALLHLSLGGQQAEVPPQPPPWHRPCERAGVPPS
ncbi:TOBE domain-containing protein [Streptomyces sp. NPDC005776]|uniref:TOBE domain-containing protein n=1 Tax=Streptomyces sp. NPDC005776 TaxID=3154676 RepID=UPI0033EA6344